MVRGSGAVPQSLRRQSHFVNEASEPLAASFQSASACVRLGTTEVCPILGFLGFCVGPELGMCDAKIASSQAVPIGPVAKSMTARNLLRLGSYDG